MKGKRFVLTGAIFFIISFLFAVYIPSKDNFSNQKNGFENRIYGLDEIHLSGWSGENGEYIAGEKAFILLENLDCFVHTIRLEGQFVPQMESVQVSYTLNPGDDFMEERSKAATCGSNGNNLYLTVDVMASALRIDFEGNAGTEMLLESIEINDRSPVFSIQGVAKYCLLPTILFGGLLQILFCRGDIVRYLDGMRRYLPLVGNLISRDLKVKYRRSVLGFLWSILNPLLMALVTNTVFAKIFRFQVEYFATYYLTGALIFNFVVECTSSSLMSVISAAPLIRKVYIPKYIFPLQKCAFAFINMLFGGVAVIVVMLIQGVPFHATALLFFLPMLYAFVFSYGFGLVLAACTVYFRDIQHLYSVFTSIWMYMTPIIYPEEVLLSSGLGIIMKLNPMYYYTHSFRSLVIYGEIPTFNENIMCMVFALLALVVGLLVFKKLQDRFILYV